MKRVFISGAINGFGKDGSFVDNCYRMIQYAGRVRNLGVAVYVPCQDLLTSFATGALSHEEYYQHDLVWLEVCDALALVPGWERSEGVKGELEKARELGLPILEDYSEVMEYVRRE